MSKDNAAPWSTKDIRRRLIKAALQLKTTSAMNERGELSPAEIEDLVDALLETAQSIAELLRRYYYHRRTGHKGASK